MLGVLLRVPQHADAEPRAEELDALHHAVGCPCRDRQALADPVGSLMVARVHLHRRPQQRLQARARLHRHAVQRKRPGRRLVQRTVHDLGQVLMEAAAALHVQELHAAADPEHRQIAIERARQQLQL